MGIPFIGDIIDAVGDLVSEAIPDPDKKREVALEMERIRLEYTKAQTEVNKEEAKHGNVFVAGWRPFVGWVCGAGLLTQAIALPLMSAVWGLTYQLDTELLIMTLGGMLGLGGMRTFEKVKNVSTNDFTDRPKAKKQKAVGLPEDAPWA